MEILKHILKFYTGIAASIVTAVLALPGLMVIAVLLGIIIRWTIEAFKVTYFW